MRAIAVLLLLVFGSLLVTPAAAATRPFPSVIPLPNGFRPEGIAVGAGTTFYTGSLGGAGIYRGDLRTGELGQLVPGEGRMFVGMKVDDRGRLWVAGGSAGVGYVFDARTGAEIATFTFPDAGFVNDVIVTKDAAWFTESFGAVLYRVEIAPNGTLGEVTTVDLSGDIDVVSGFNLNGIAATPDGSTLIVVNSATGKLYAIDASTLAAHEIDLGGATLTGADGILLHGRTLYAARNRFHQIAVVELAPDLASGSVVDVITNAAFDFPTTLARHGNALYAVNARFSTTPTPTTTYTIVRVDR